ncbi:MAG: DNA primase [Chitinophagaceae bacterium]|jgi:DNA primase|nr:DNA primase [Chitinophagaceae bacterium]
MISPQTIQQITNRIDILDVIGEFVKLKKRGANYLGLCPFHGEKSPSFTVSPVKEIYKCFGCGRSGNTITFLMEHEKYSYVESLRWLAARYNIEIEETQLSDEARQQMQVADSLYIINSFAQKFFSQQLKETEEGKNIALSYLHERGFSNDIIEKFQLGYNPQQRDAFTQQALQSKYNPELLIKAGLTARRNNDELADNYRGRIIFPIHNHSGKIIGFGARVIGKVDKAPKYINTPENDIYVKSKILYGSYFARHAIDKYNECLLVEGYTDVISLYQAGIENVVASGGTSLTGDQLRLIKKYTNNLTIIYDGDAAGIKAALRGLDMALDEGLNVRLVLIPDSEDPDSYVRKTGASAFREFVADNKKDFILFQLEIMLKDAGDDIVKKNEAVNHIAETLSKISRPEDFVKQQEYIRRSASILKIDEEGLITLVNKYKRDRLEKEEKKQFQNNVPQNAEEDVTTVTEEVLPLAPNDDLQEKNILRLLLEYGIDAWDEQNSFADYILKELDGFPFDNQELDKLLEIYETQYKNRLQPTAKTLLYHEDEDIRKMVVSITFFPFEVSPRWNEKTGNIDTQNKDTRHEDTVKSLIYFKLRKIKKHFEENQKSMEQALGSPDEIIKHLKVHADLKMMELELAKQLGAVIVK